MLPYYFVLRVNNRNHSRKFIDLLCSLSSLFEENATLINYLSSFQNDVSFNLQIYKEIAKIDPQINYFARKMRNSCGNQRFFQEIIVFLQPLIIKLSIWTVNR